MSRESDVIGHAIMLLEQTVAFTVNGTADNPRRIRRVDLASEHIKDWMSRFLPRDGERGGSSSPREADDRAETRQVAAQVRRDHEALAAHLKALNFTARAVYDIVQRNVETIHPAKLPATSGGCRSCVRVEEIKGTKIGGHFAPVYEKAKKWGLCRWCYEVRMATGKLPPVKACDVYHRQGARAAGRLLNTAA